MRKALTRDDLFIASSWANNIEVMAIGADKGSGLQTLCEKLGVPMEQVMAIGDNENDETMLKAAGLSVAMENATDHIKSICNTVTLDCNHSGVGHAIEQYVLRTV